MANTITHEEKEYNFDFLVQYMDDEIREKVHMELAPCTNQEFWDRYCELDSKYEELLNIVGEVY